MLEQEEQNMPTYKLQLNSPSAKTKERMKEVQFYIFLESFFYKYNSNNQYIVQLIESLAELFECRPTVLSIMIDNFKSPLYKPTKEEIAVTAFHLGIPVRRITKITQMGIETYYRKIQSYKTEGQQELEPRLTNDFTIELEKFLKHATYMFNDVSSSLKGTDIYDRD